MPIWVWPGLLIGFVLLIKGADLVVDGAASLAVQLSVSEIVVALTVVAFGTSSPELIINVFASLNHQPDISFGNIIGSNIVNILLILGVAGLIYPIRTHRNTVWREIPFSLIAVIVLGIMCNDRFFNGAPDALSREDALILLIFFAVFLIYIFLIARVDLQEKPEIKRLPGWKIALYLLIGLLGLFAGGRLVIDNALQIARALHVSERLISLTTIAAGTSLPELFTSAVAAYKKNSDIAIGNVVGSNIFNIFFILGVTALIDPLPFNPSFNLDLMVLLVVSGLLFLTMFTGKRRVLDRWEASIFLLLYLAYIIFTAYTG